MRPHECHCMWLKIYDNLCIGCITMYYSCESFAHLEFRVTIEGICLLLLSSFSNFTMQNVVRLCGQKQLLALLIVLPKPYWTTEHQLNWFSFFFLTSIHAVHIEPFSKNWIAWCNNTDSALGGSLVFLCLMSQKTLLLTLLKYYISELSQSLKHHTEHATIERNTRSIGNDCWSWYVLTV